MDAKKVRYGIVGIGKQGTAYTRIFTKLGWLVKGAELTAVCDIDPKRRKYAEENLKGVKVFEDYRDMLSSGLIDVVMIDTPHYFHPEIAIAAMRAGINVLCDKPAGVYTKQVREMNEEAKKHPELLFGMMFNQRTNPLYIKAKEIIESGKLGKLTRIVWIITNWYRPKAYYAQGGWRGTWWGEGGGVLLNQCPHQLDLFTWLAGLPSSVTATLSTVGRDISVENDVTAYCKFESGATGVFITSTHDAPGTNRLEIKHRVHGQAQDQEAHLPRHRALSRFHEVSAPAHRHNQELHRLPAQKDGQVHRARRAGHHGADLLQRHPSRGMDAFRGQAAPRRREVHRRTREEKGGRSG